MFHIYYFKKDKEQLAHDNSILSQLGGEVTRNSSDGKSHWKGWHNS